MLKEILTQTAKHVVAKQVGKKFDLKLGFALFKDKRISPLHKLLSIGIGAAATGVCIALEIPLELIVSAFLGIFGFALDVVADGVEIAVITSMVGCLVLPFIADKETVNQIMFDRSESKAMGGEINKIS